MATLQWNEDWDTGIAVIDDQHRRIVFYINELERVTQSGDALAVRQVIDGLVDYTTTHFKFEEELQQRANYPFFKAHKRVHDIFTRRITGFVERADNGEAVIDEMLSMLRIWLISHINGDDRDYVESVERVLAAETAETAGWMASTLKRLFGRQAEASGLRP